MNCRRAEHLIAIIDDEDPVRQGLERLLRASGYAVESHASGADFLRSLDTSRPCCILLDLHMPAVTGIDVLKALAQQAAAIPAIVVTADCTPVTLQRVMSLGARECLNKPVDAATLLDAISAALRNSHCA